MSRKPVVSFDHALEASLRFGVLTTARYVEAVPAAPRSDDEWK